MMGQTVKAVGLSGMAVSQRYILDFETFGRAFRCASAALRAG